MNACMHAGPRHRYLYLVLCLCLSVATLSSLAGLCLRTLHGDIVGHKGFKTLKSRRLQLAGLARSDSLPGSLGICAKINTAVGGFCVGKLIVRWYVKQLQQQRLCQSVHLWPLRDTDSPADTHRCWHEDDLGASRAASTRLGTYRAWKVLGLKVLETVHMQEGLHVCSGLRHNFRRKCLSAIGCRVRSWLRTCILRHTVKPVLFRKHRL